MMEYERTQGGAKLDGLRYECYMAALLYLRCLREEVDDFRLGCNVNGLDPFDDVVMRFTSEGKPRCVLIQMKHREKGRQVTLNQLLASETSKKNDFSLKKYHKSYCNIQKSCTVIPILDGLDFTDCEFVIFTNSVVQHKSCKITNLSPWENLVNAMGGTDSEIFSFTPEDEEIWSLCDGQEDSELYHTFIHKLRVFSGQCNVHRLREMVEDEVETSAHVRRKPSENLLNSFLAEIEAWWNNDELGRERSVEDRTNRIQYLTKFSPYWYKPLISHLNIGMKEKLRRIDCTWKPDSIAYLNELLTTDVSMNVFAPDTDCILQCARIFVELEKHFREKYLLMDATDVQREIENVRSVCQWALSGASHSSEE